ncbi:MAG: SUMF1/EgtB/PvdO family nonheme iron enzyme [Planctomycetota bacterium]
MGQQGLAEPVHPVKITKPFYLGKYVVTQAQYEKVMGANPSRWKGADLPVEQVSWDDAKKFCEVATTILSRDRKGAETKPLANARGSELSIRLPTEAQWEYACRAGTTTEYNTGQGEAALEKAGWYIKNSGGKTNPVGKKAPNAWGLYDMHGNVWEWCEDRWGERYDAQAAQADPTGPTTSNNRVLRGGAWCNDPGGCCCACRDQSGPGGRVDRDGFRVRMALPLGGAPVAVQPETPIQKPETPPAPPPAEVAAYAKANGLEPALSLDLGGGVKMEMVLVPAGEFMMGSEDDPEAKPEEKPAHKVKISQPFYIGKYDVTVAQFRVFADARKFQTEAEKGGEGWTAKDGKPQFARGVNWRNPGFKQEDNHPVVVVTWNDTQEFCKWASEVAQASGLRTQSGGLRHTVRLPTEAEWEYAARGPKNPKYPWGDKWEGIPANVADASLRREGFNMQWGEIKEDDGYPFTSPGGAYKNASWCGAFDMAGNVWQWCQDYFNDKYYGESPAVDPQGPATGGERVLRCGCWIFPPAGCRSAYRRTAPPGNRDATDGFRVVVECALARKEAPIQPAATNQKPETPALPKETSLDLGGVKMDMVLVPAGEFMMGADDGEANEKPLHKVKISQPFYIGKYDVTVEQFRVFADATNFQTEAEKYKTGNTAKDGKWQMDAAGVNWKQPGFAQTPQHPVVLVSWNDAQSFTAWLTRLSGRDIRLPTEAQWEYVARGPGSPKYPWGEKWEGIPANVADASLKAAGFSMEWGQINEDDGFPYTSPVGHYKNSASWCGAFDMAGNVWQLVEDRFSDKYYAVSPNVDPLGPTNGGERVSRGGSWANVPGICRCARRTHWRPEGRAADCGFRCVLALPGGGAPVAVQPQTTIQKPETPSAPPPAEVAAYAKANGLEPALSLDLGGVKMDMVLVPAGEFMMGSNDGRDDEKPVHKVKISKPFYMGKYTVTVAQFRAFAAATKHVTEAEKCGKGFTMKDGKWQELVGLNWMAPGFSQGDKHPACLITWNDAQEFCKWAAMKTGRGVGLPTEAQWEYACRAGTTTKYNIGDKDSDIEQAAWCRNNSGLHTHPVGQKKQNAWGLYDMHGNVCQWVQDYFSDKYYADSPPVDPKGPENGERRVLRGGCWNDNPEISHSAHRDSDKPANPNASNGFRCALDLPGGGAPVTVQPETTKQKPDAGEAGAWLPLDLSSSCTVDIISTATHQAADQFTHSKGTLTSASWLRQNGNPEPGIPEDGRVAIPDTQPAGFLQVRMPPAKNAFLLSGPQGRQPQPVTVDLALNQRGCYAELAILHCTHFGNGTVRVTLRYETGPEGTAILHALDWNPKREGPVPANLRLAVTVRDTFGHGKVFVGEMFAERIPADPRRILRSLVFTFDTLTAPMRNAEEAAKGFFTIGIFALSARPAGKQPIAGKIDDPAAKEAKKKQDESWAGREKTRAAQPDAGALPKELTLDLGGGVRMDMVLVPAGEFMMGSSRKPSASWQGNEGPVHKVTITKPYYVGKYPVTVAQFTAFVHAKKYETECEKGGNRGNSVKDGRFSERTDVNWRQPGFEQAPDHPVVLVSWNDAQAFVAWASGQTGRDVRLPSEAQWEYAARGPKSLEYPFGDKWDGLKVNHGDVTLKNSGWREGSFSNDNDGYAFTSPVGKFNNASWCGAYDMVGNVWQWIQDWRADYPAEAQVDPQGPADGQIRVTHGGCWDCGPEHCRAACRAGTIPTGRWVNGSFRVAVDARGGTAGGAVQP